MTPIAQTKPTRGIDTPETAQRAGDIGFDLEELVPTEPVDQAELSANWSGTLQSNDYWQNGKGHSAPFIR